jgi:hypothetical protein
MTVKKAGLVRLIARIKVGQAAPPQYELFNELCWAGRNAIHCPESVMVALQKYMLTPGTYLKEVWDTDVIFLDQTALVVDEEERIVHLRIFVSQLAKRCIGSGQTGFLSRCFPDVLQPKKLLSGP